ncbi:uncharacterized protein [Heterodontus francisci]|uniref:uncharacterized protein isoform X1 n=1 Tax=Heterodontus francisci TaxID=7792 RepID=UPI00355B04B8
MSPCIRILICLAFFLQQGQGELTCQISQKELIVVAVVNESVKIVCEYKCSRLPQPSNTSVQPIKFTLQLFKVSPKNIVKEITESHNAPTFTMNCRLRVKSREDSGIYYCRGKADSNVKTATGTFLQVQDAYYVEHPPSLSLQYILASICTILAVYCGSATSAVLIKRKTCYWCKTHVMKTPAPDTLPLSATPRMPNNTESQQENRPHNAEPADSDNAYMALQTHQQSFYCTLNKNSSSIHNCAGANQSPKRQGAQIVEAGADVYECVYESY